MHKIWLFLFCITCTPKISFSQSDANSFKIKAEELYEKDSLLAAFSTYEKARILFEKNNDWGEAGECLISNGYIFYDIREYQKATNYIDSLIPFYKKNLKQKKPIIYGRILNCIALNHKRAHNYFLALKYYEEAIRHNEEFKLKGKFPAYSLRNAAQIQERFLNNTTALNYNLAALKIDPKGKYTASIYGHLISNYTSIEKHEKAIEHYTKSIELEKTPKEKIIINSNTATAYFELNNFKKVKELSLKNITLINNNERYGYTPWIEYKNLAEINTKWGNLKKAESYYLKSIEKAKEEYGTKDREIAKVHTEAGHFFFEQNKLTQALAHYQQALIQVFPNFNSTDINDNPSIEDIYTESWIMTASARKGEALLARYNLNKNIADLKNASECFDLSLAGIKALIKSYGTDNAKLYLGDYSHGHFENAIQVNYLLFKETGEKKYLEKIFSIMEKSKASVLEEAIQKNRALILSGIPDSLLLKEKELRLELADLNTSIKKEELYEEEKDEEYISERRTKIVSRQREYETLLEELKNKFPTFKNYTAENTTPSISDIQNYLLKNNEVLLEYFIGEENIYLIKIKSDDSEIMQMPHTDFWDDQLGDFQDYFRNSTAIINDPRGYYTAAENFYQLVFPFDSLEEKIIIVPDGNLNFIPFDALVKEQPEKTNFTEVNFLINNHQIRYAYSAGLLLQPITTSKKRELRRIAPAFFNGQRGLSTLEARTENKTLDFKTMSGEEATLSAFRQVADQCKVIEFFTHAGADESEVAPRIEFIDTSLYLPELYAMDIPAELVVLSACETGLGKFEKGEGVMSLARGFAYAGTADLVASLWKVNETSTASLIDYFYQYLSVGETKAEALRKAKLQYIKNAKSESRQSPYYWAGFVSIGPNGVMDFSQPRSFHWWLVSSIAVIVILGQLWRRRKGLSR